MKNARNSVFAMIVISAAMLGITETANANESCPRVLGNWPLESPSAVAMDSHRGVYAEGFSLRVVDLEDPFGSSSTTINLGERIEHLVLLGDHLWTLTEHHRLVAVEIGESNELQPVFDETLEGTPLYIAGSEDTLILIDENGLSLIDVHEPENPQLIGSLEREITMIADVAITPDHLIIAEHQTVAFVSITDAATPTLVGTWEAPLYSDDILYGVAVADTVLYVVGESIAVQVVDIQDMSAPERITSFYNEGATAVECGEGFLVVTRRWAQTQFDVFDISQPESPTLSGRLGLPGDLEMVAGLNNRFLVSGGGNIDSEWPGVALIDVSFPERPVIEWRIPPVQNVTSVAGTGDTLYLGTLQHVAVLDITEPADARLTGTFRLDDTPNSIAAQGDLVAAAIPNKGVFTIDASDPAQPVAAGTVLTWGTSEDIEWQDDFLYVADGWTGLAVIDASDPTEMTVVGRWSTPEPALKIAVDASLAAVALDNEAGIRLFDVSDPENLREQAVLETPGGGQNMALDSGYLYVADRYHGVTVFDVRDPSTPIAVTTIEPESWAYSVAVVNNRLWVAGSGGGSILVFDINDPAIPNLVGNTPERRYPYNLHTTDDLVVCSGYLDMFLFEAESCDPPPRNPDGRGGS